MTNDEKAAAITKHTTADQRLGVLDAVIHAQIEDAYVTEERFLQLAQDMAYFVATGKVDASV